MSILSDISENLQKGKAKIVKTLVQQAIDEGIEPLRFDCFPRCEDYLLRLRERVNAALCK